MTRRGEIIDAVGRGSMTPTDAESIAEKEGLGPFACEPSKEETDDPATLPLWSMAMAVTWIATEDMEQVRACLDEYRLKTRYWSLTTGGDQGKQYAWSLTPAEPTNFLRLQLDSDDDDSISNAWTTLRKRLMSGDITAVGTPAGQSAIIAIPADDWQGLKAFEQPRGRETWISASPYVAYGSVMVRRQTLVPDTDLPKSKPASLRAPKPIRSVWLKALDAALKAQVARMKPGDVFPGIVQHLKLIKKHPGCESIARDDLALRRLELYEARVQKQGGGSRPT